MTITKSNIEIVISTFKNSETYQDFQKVLHEKIDNEALAKQILQQNIGRINSALINEIMNLIDTPYKYGSEGNHERGPWFGRLFKPNARILLKEDLFRINQWFNVLFDENITIVKRLDLLRSEPYHIKGLNAGFITLMLYLLDNSKYSIWFLGQHEGFRNLYPELNKYTGNSKQYFEFNDLSKKFVKRFNFEHAELDWILSRNLTLQDN